MYYNCIFTVYGHLWKKNFSVPVPKLLRGVHLSFQNCNQILLKTQIQQLPTSCGHCFKSKRRKSTQHQSSSIFYHIINPIQGAKICHVLAFGMHCQCLCMKRIIRDQCQVASDEHVNQVTSIGIHGFPKQIKRVQLHLSVEQCRDDQKHPLKNVWTMI